MIFNRPLILKDGRIVTLPSNESLEGSTIVSVELPASQKEGVFWWSPETKELRIFFDNNWETVSKESPALVNYDREVKVFEAEDGQTHYSTEYISDSIDVYVNGIYQIHLKDFVALNGKDIIFISPLHALDSVVIVKLGVQSNRTLEVNSIIELTRVINTKYEIGNIDIFKNGVYQNHLHDYIALTGSHIEFNDDLLKDDELVIIKHSKISVNSQVFRYYYEVELFDTLTVTIPGEYDPGAIEVFIEGVFQIPSSYNGLDGKTITFKTRKSGVLSVFKSKLQRSYSITPSTNGTLNVCNIGVFPNRETAVFYGLLVGDIFKTPDGHLMIV